MLSIPKLQRAVACGLSVLAAFFGMGVARAQIAAAPLAPPSVSFSALAQSILSRDYTIVQLRRFFTANGIVTVRERARVDANGTRRPDYEFDFLGVEGEPQGSPLWQEWAQHYNDHGRTFFEHGLFRVRNLTGARQNYTLHDFGAVTRVGRSARRVVVFPNRMDKSIWLLEVDAATLVPLYIAEYDMQVRLQSEIEAVSFGLGAQLGPATSASSLVTTLPDFGAARVFLGHPVGIVEPSGSTGEYSLDQVQVRVDPLNNRRTLVLSYTDGIDEFFVTETFGVPDVMANLPLRQPSTFSHAIARFREPALSVLLFWDDNVAFQVSGRGSLVRLDDFAKAIYTLAVYNR